MLRRAGRRSAASVGTAVRRLTSRPALLYSLGLFFLASLTSGAAAGLLVALGWLSIVLHLTRKKVSVLMGMPTPALLDEWKSKRAAHAVALSPVEYLALSGRDGHPSRDFDDYATIDHEFQD